MAFVCPIYQSPLFAALSERLALGHPASCVREAGGLRECCNTRNSSNNEGVVVVIVVVVVMVAVVVVVVAAAVAQ